MVTSNTLFSGERWLLGGLSNEEALATECPQEFKEGSRWSDYVARCIANSLITNADWKWKSEDVTERARQWAHFQGLLATYGLSHEDKVAVAGWMLSEMLSEFPATK